MKTQEEKEQQPKEMPEFQDIEALDVDMSDDSFFDALDESIDAYYNKLNKK